MEDVAKKRKAGSHQCSGCVAMFEGERTVEA